MSQEPPVLIMKAAAELAYRTEQSMPVPCRIVKLSTQSADVCLQHQHLTTIMPWGTCRQGQGGD